MWRGKVDAAGLASINVQDVASNPLGRARRTSAAATMLYELIGVVGNIGFI